MKQSSSQMRAPLGVAVIGLGVGEQHAHAYARHPQCELKWLFDLSVSKAKDVLPRVAISGPAGAIAPSFEAILADPDVDLISIATYDNLHFEEVVQAFNAGKHVFVEKPLCRTQDELAQVARAWQSGGRVHLASNLVLREAALYKWLKAQVDAGAFGDIYAIDAEYLYGRLPKITAGWRKDVDDYSVMEGGGIHMIDLMTWIAGENPERVMTLGNRIATQDTSFGYDDYQSATFTFSSGLIGRISANFACVHRHHHVLRVYGTKATFIYDDAGARLHTTRDEATGAKPVCEAPLPEGKGVLIPDFIEAICTGTDPEPQAKREFDLVSMCAHSDQSRALRREVAIEYMEI